MEINIDCYIELLLERIGPFKIRHLKQLTQLSLMLTYQGGH